MRLTSSKQLEVEAESVPSSLRIICDDASSIALQAAQPAEDGKPVLRKFSMTAYTGGAMRLGGWAYPVVVDLAGMRVNRKSRPILKDHDRSSIVGHTSDIAISESRLQVEGVISGVGSTAQEVIATSENGFPWQASLGASADKVVFIPEGKTAQANGREHVGPIYIARKSSLGEVSFVALGADDDTEARVAAGRVVDGDESDDTDADDLDSESVNDSLQFEATSGSKQPLEAGFSGIPATFTVTPLVEFNGQLPVGTVTVQNIYRWASGSADGAVLVLWNPVDQQWEPAQMECS